MYFGTDALTTFDVKIRPLRGQSGRILTSNVVNLFVLLISNGFAGRGVWVLGAGCGAWGAGCVGVLGGEGVGVRGAGCSPPAPAGGGVSVRYQPWRAPGSVIKNASLSPSDRRS